MIPRFRLLYALVFVVLAIGLVVGIAIAFTGLSDRAVLVGLTVLAGLLTTLLVVMGDRSGLDEHDHWSTPQSH